MPHNPPARQVIQIATTAIPLRAWIAWVDESMGLDGVQLDSRPIVGQALAYDGEHTDQRHVLTVWNEDFGELSSLGEALCSNERLVAVLPEGDKPDAAAVTAAVTDLRATAA